MKKIYIGTAGWSYKDWVGPFYARGQSAGYNWLRFYSNRFNCVEVNSTFYAYQKNSVVNGWVEKVSFSDDFIFEIKLHRDFTHLRQYDNAGVSAVKENLDILKDSGRLGALLIQFPYSFQMNDAAASYVSKLSETFEEYKKVIEVRHNSWNNEKGTELFDEHGLTLCTVDQPVIGRALRFNITVSGRKAYLRLHGRNKDEWFKSIGSFNTKQSYDERNARYNYNYSIGELTEIKMMIEEHFYELDEIHVIFNNHPGGNAPVNAIELGALMEKQVPAVLKEKTLGNLRLRRAAGQ